jgi:FkbM family methyltransferase
MFLSFNRQKACRHGMMVYNTNDLYIGRSLELYGEWSEGEVEMFRKVVKPGETVVEIGANIGTHTVYFAQAVGPHGRVWAFEPQRIVFQTLCANLALNNLTNVEALQVAVGNAPGEIMVPLLDYYQANNFGGVSLGHFSRGDPVQVITLDSLNLPRCDLLKIDVEGMEAQVLEGAAATIARCQPYLYVENDRDDKSRPLIELINGMGYKMYWHMPEMYRADNFFANPENVFGDAISLNMYCIPKSKLPA